MALYDLALDQCSDDLRLLAARGEAPIVVGREAESRQLRELILARRSVLLVGEAGVGKTSVIHRTVSDCDAGAIAGASSGPHIFRTSTSRMISETKYLGEWQSKVTSLVRELESIDGSALYVTDIWNLTSVGRSESTHETMADLLKEFIESHRISVIGEATKAQITSFLDQMPSFRNVFVQLRVDPVPPDSVRPILSTAAANLAARRDVRFEQSALDRAVELTDRFVPYRHQPGKAIDLFERAVHHAAQSDASDSAVVTPHVVDELLAGVRTSDVHPLGFRADDDGRHPCFLQRTRPRAGARARSHRRDHRALQGRAQ
ncbi:MAG: AAA family ATPase [Blastocatellia bacterium]|nr:AAA family ATPase [Blastocatellia bacterium]